MSTVPAPCAPELPSTSAPNSAGVTVSDWHYSEDAAKSTLVDNEADTTTDTDTQSTPAASNSSTAYSYTGSELNGSKNAAKDTAGAGSNADTTNEEKADDSMYECNICLDTAKDAVVSMCGHLFCWPCLHQWLQTRPNRKLCPVCKAAISREKVIPLYGRNSSKQEDPRNKVPPRPAGRRTEPDPQSYGLGFGDGFHMSFGIGAFPFGFFASSFNIGDTRGTPNRGTTQYDEDQNLSKLFIYLAILCIAWLLFA